MKKLTSPWQLILLSFLLFLEGGLILSAEESLTTLEEEAFVFTENEQLNIAIDPSEALSFRVIFNNFINYGKVAIKETYFTPYSGNSLPQKVDIVTLNRAALRNFCEDNLLINIDWDYIPHKNLFNQTARETCGIGYRVEGTALAYSKLHYYGTPPHQWHDFFDTNKYPGLRALPQHAHHLLEIALLAKGYPIKEVYRRLESEEGQKEALAKFDEISDSLLWWETITQAQEWLNSGRISMAIVPAGAIQSPLNQEKNFSINYFNMIYGMEYLAIPKASSKEELALSFIAYATRPEQQLNFSKVSPSGMSLKVGWSLLSESLVKTLTNSPQNLINAIPENYSFYQSYGTSLESIFQAWKEASSLHIHTIEVSSFDSHLDDKEVLDMSEPTSSEDEEDEVLEIETISVTPNHNSL